MVICLLHQGTCATFTLHSSVAYFKNMMYDLLAYVRCLGTPTLFMTLSVDDLHWPELGMSLEDIDFDEPRD